MVKLPYSREHSGDEKLDRVQRLAQQAAQKANSIEERLAILEALFLDGSTIIPLNDADQIISKADQARWIIHVTGALTAARVLKGFYQPLNERESYTRLLYNSTSGGFNVNFTTTTGLTAAAGAGGSGVARFTPSGVAFYVL